MFFKQARAKIKRLVDDPKGADDLVVALRHRVESGKIASRMERIALDPANHYYLDNWAVSSYEKFGLNENADGFEKEELLRSHPTFVGSWVCLDHNNYHESLAVGSNIDAIYTPDDYVRIVMGVNRHRSESRHPGLEKKIASGAITDTSMGCWCRESVCNVPKCGNVATEESQFCEHIAKFRGKELCNAATNWVPVRVGELNRGVIFFEDSIITDAEGADRNAKIISKLAFRQSGPKSIPGDVLWKVLTSMLKNASPEEKVVITQLTEALIREL
jgi:hypothetical protein